MGKLNQKLGDTLGGKGGDVELLLKKWGISLKDANGNLKSGIDILPQLADGFKQNEDPIIRAKIGMTLFGKKWQEIAPMLMAGGEGIAEATERMKKFKGVMDEETIEGAREFARTMRDAEFVTKGFQAVIAKSLAPVIQPLIEQFSEWAAANKKLVAVRVGEWAKKIAEYVETIDFGNVLQGISNFIDSAGKFVEAVGGMKNVLIGLVLYMNVSTIQSLIGLTASLWRASLGFFGMAVNAYVAANAGLMAFARLAIGALFGLGPVGMLSAAYGWLAAVVTGSSGLMSGAIGMVSAAFRGLGAAMMANPLGIILGIAAAAYLIYENWDTLKKWFTSFFNWVGDKFKSMLGWITDVAKSVGQFFGANGSVNVSQAAANQNGQGGMMPSIMNQNANRSPLIAPPAQVRASGKIEVSFKDAPAGMRVEQTATAGDVPVNTSVGYRSYATGLNF